MKTRLLFFILLNFIFINNVIAMETGPVDKDRGCLRSRAKGNSNDLHSEPDQLPGPRGKFANNKAEYDSDDLGAQNRKFCTKLCLGCTTITYIFCKACEVIDY